jgi:hypothetical protein
MGEPTTRLNGATISKVQTTSASPENRILKGTMSLCDERTSSTLKEAIGGSSTIFVGFISLSSITNSSN